MSDLDEPTPWDEDDPRRQNDSCAPPTEACECWCMHCGRTFSSDDMWLQRIINGQPGDFEGFWMCPTPNCGGAGFTFDIFPTDPDHPANAGWHDSDADEDEFEDEFEDEEDSEIEAAASHDLAVLRGDDETPFDVDDDNPFGGSEDDDVIEPGDEWKLGYAPDEPAPPGIYGDAETRAEQERYDQPDERPRVIDRSKQPPDELRGADDIPF